jgi:hypothetical protein
VTEQEFTQELVALGHAFDKPLEKKPERVAEYMGAFGNLTEKQWASICGWAKSTCEYFPTIAVLRGQAMEMGFLRRAKRFDQDDHFTIVECVCGASFAVFKTDLKDPKAKFKCNAWGCNTSYDSGFIVRNAVNSVVNASDALRREEYEKQEERFV